MLRIAYDVVKPILSFHVCTEAEKYFQTPWNSPSGCWVAVSPRFQEWLLHPWARPFGPNGQINMMHIYRARQFQRTLFGVNRPSCCGVTASAKSGRTDGRKDGWRLFCSPLYFPSERWGTKTEVYCPMLLSHQMCIGEPTKHTCGC